MSSRVGAGTTAGEARAWGWVAHLRAGGTTPWGAWRDADDPTHDGPAAGRLLPGAQQLELLRHLNGAGSPGPSLAGRVLTVSAPGRGRPDLELEGAVARLAFGPAPVDPAELPTDELVRVATMLVAEDLVAAGVPPAPRPPVGRRLRRAVGRTAGPSYHLDGDPWLARALRRQLVAQGRAATSDPGVVVVLGTDLATMLADLWTARAFADGAGGWQYWLRDLAGHDRLPPRLDLAATLGSWAERIGADRVHLVLDPAALAGLLDLPGPPPAAPRPRAAAVELARLSVDPLGLLVLPARRAALLREVLLPRLLGPAGSVGPELRVPAAHADWLHHRAELLREAVRATGCVVHGDPDRLLPTPASETAPPDPPLDRALVLEVALRLLLDGRDGAAPFGSVGA